MSKRILYIHTLRGTNCFAKVREWFPACCTHSVTAPLEIAFQALVLSMTDWLSTPYSCLAVHVVVPLYIYKALTCSSKQPGITVQANHPHGRGIYFTRMPCRDRRHASASRAIVLVCISQVLHGIICCTSSYPLIWRQLILGGAPRRLLLLRCSLSWPREAVADVVHVTQAEGRLILFRRKISHHHLHPQSLRRSPACTRNHPCSLTPLALAISKPSWEKRNV